ncbi:hypothetical protein NA57DRAFT_48993 [Rhizodiscina lignyota]|uniref:Uncharacterized protein n=1 Tax=Rhizodiscina lignyota TaxID=1504668 RepID=A0A9P4M4M5_9PEZI|nr:hypothetical protein NA57DRAFT_48993 [Rhizodiscina lignyota]
MQAPYIYTETRLDLDEASPGSTIELILPSSNYSIARASPTRRIVTTESLVQDEDTFLKEHIATESSIYLRRASRSPRVFLWRLLESRTVLELQAVDLHQDKSVPGDAVLTLLLRFPRPLRPFGVALADPDERDALCVFAVTDRGDLYTLTLKREMFVHAKASEADMGDWCRVVQPSAFSFQFPYKLFALSALELVVALHNGGLLRLLRKPGDDGASWRDTFFSEGSWGSTLKGLIPFQGHKSVRFGDLDLEANTTSSLALSPDGKHFIAVGLDHVLRAWNIESGRIGMQTDLLGENTPTDRKTALYLMGAEQKQLLQLVPGDEQNGILYYMVSYSPKAHQFKIWGVLDADSGLQGLRDVRDDVQFIPPLDELMDASVWTLEEFHVIAKSHWRESEIWIRARSGPVSQVFTLKFDLFANKKDLQHAWRDNWATVNSGPLSFSRLNDRIPDTLDRMAFDTYSASLTDQWLDFLFYPGRFSPTALGTALHVYSRRTIAVTHRGEPLGTSFSKMPLKQQVCDAIMHAAQANIHNSQHSNHSQANSDVATQWRLFYGLVKDFQKRRSHALSFAYDDAQEVPWLVCADYISALRECSAVEIMHLNPQSPLSNRTITPSHPLAAYFDTEADFDVVTLFHAAHALTSGFPRSFRQTLRAAAAVEVLEELSDAVNERMEAFDHRTNLCAQVKDDDVSRLTDVLKEIGGYTEVDNNIFFSALEKLSETIRGSQGRLVITRYGAKALIRGSQETLQLAIDTLLDLLSLAIFMGLDLEPTELSPQFDAQTLYVELITQLREHYLLEWFASTVRQVHTTPSIRAQPASSVRDSTALFDTDLSHLDTSLMPSDPGTGAAQTVMESMFIGDWSAILTPHDQPGSKLLTYWCRAWTYGADVQSNYNELTAHVLAFLLKSGDVNITQEFTKFMQTTPWSGYITARLDLAQGEFEAAARLFRKCSFGLSLGQFDVHDSDRAGLLTPDERDLFSDGLFRYYQHVIGLFEKYKAHSYVADFANLALQALQVQNEDVDERAQVDILSQLFNAYMVTSRFDEAYSTLGKFNDKALRTANLTTFLKALLSERVPPSTSNTILKTFPFSNLASEADSIILSLATKQLSAMTGLGARAWKSLYGFRISRNDFRGAAEALWCRLQRLRSSGEKAADPDSREGEEVRRLYLALANCLSCVDEAQAWIFAEEVSPEPPRGGGLGAALGRSARLFERKERKIVTLGDVRKMYGEELDRVEAVSMGRFAFGGTGLDGAGGGEEMDVL